MTISARLIATAMIAASALVGCGATSPPSRTPPPPTSFRLSQFTAANFRLPIGPPNQWLPIVPGTQWVRVGATDVGHRRVPHRVLSTVTSVHKRIAGIDTIVVLDLGIDSGQVAHESIDFFAQDRRGNVWNVGSYAEAYEAGRYVSVRDAWLAGKHGGRAGILMQGDPGLQTPPWYISQPPGADPDVAQVVQTGLGRCVPFRCFKNVLVVREGKASAPDNEFKYYAAGVGQIDNVPKSASMHHDVEQLVNARRLTAQGLAEASAEALKLDRHARVTSPSVFASGPPARRAG